MRARIVGPGAAPVVEPDPHSPWVRGARSQDSGAAASLRLCGFDAQIPGTVGRRRWLIVTSSPRRSAVVGLCS